MLLTAMAANLPLKDTRSDEARRSLSEAIDRLAILKERNNAAASGEKVLKWCCRKLLGRKETTKIDTENTDHQAARSTPLMVSSNGPESLMVEREHSDAASIHPQMSLNQDDDNIWDFLPMFDRSEELLTAMAVDSSYTSDWLQESLADFL